jgi:hypothetical protein
MRMMIMTTKSNDKICEICRRQINCDVDNWTLMEDYKGKNKVRTIYLHEICFRERFKMMVKLDTMGRGLIKKFPQEILPT